MKTRTFAAALAATLLAVGSCTHQDHDATEAPAPGKPVIYQMLVRIFGNVNTTNRPGGTLADNGCGHLSDVSPEALQSIRRLGATWVWYTGIIQQATQTDWSAYGLPRQTPGVVKGQAGSPYAICDYYAVSAELADSVGRRMEEFRDLVGRTHAAGLKVMIDFVPNHVAREYHSTMRPDSVADLGAHDDTSQAFAPTNNFYYFPGQTLHWQGYDERPARVSGNDVFGSVTPAADDWYETVKLNYGVEYRPDGSREGHFDPTPATWRQMTDILLYWCAQGVDGFRCDMAEMVPTAFWHYATARVRSQYPATTFVAEIYNPAAYADYIAEGGFDYLYDKVQLYDSVRAVTEGRRPVDAIRACLPALQSGPTAGHMLHFLENHDEQRIASAQFAGSPWAAMPALYVSALIDGGPYLHYFAGELGEDAPDAEGYQGADGRTTIFDYWGLERMKAWHEAAWDETQLPEAMRSLRQRYADVLALTRRPAVAEGQTVDLTTEGMRRAGVMAFSRCAPTDTLTVVANFSAQPYAPTPDDRAATGRPLPLLDAHLAEPIPAHEAIAF